MSDATGTGYETHARQQFGPIFDFGASVWDAGRKTFIEFGEFQVEQAKIELEKARIDAQKSNINAGGTGGNLFGNFQAGPGVILAIVVLGFGLAVMRG